MLVTCMQKKLKNKSLQNASGFLLHQNVVQMCPELTKLLVYGDQLHADKGRDKVQQNTEHCGDRLLVEEGENQVKLILEHYDAHLHAEEGEDRVNLPSERRVDHLHTEEGEYQV